MRGAHVEHAVHGCDAGRVEAQRLVEECVLPSRKEGVRCGARCVGREAGGRWPAAAHERHAWREGPAVEAGGARACVERTWNMLLMSVTLDVSQLETSTLKFRKLQKRQLMSVMPETSQSATGPYVAMADAESALTAWTAVCRAALLVKVPGGDAGGDGGGGGGEGGDGGGLGDGEIVETIEMPLGNELAL